MELNKIGRGSLIGIAAAGLCYVLFRSTGGEEFLPQQVYMPATSGDSVASPWPRQLETLRAKQAPATMGNSPEDSARDDGSVGLAPHPSHALRVGFRPKPLRVRFDPSCGNLTADKKALTDLDELTFRSSGMKGLDFLPQAERVVQFHYSWTSGAGSFDVGLMRSGDGPAFYDVTYVKNAADAASQNDPEAFTGGGRTLVLGGAQERLERHLAKAPADARAGTRHLKMERLVPDGAGAIEVRSAKFENGSAVSYTEPGLACARSDSQEVAACFCSR